MPMLDRIPYTAEYVRILCHLSREIHNLSNMKKYRVYFPYSMQGFFRAIYTYISWNAEKER